MKRVAVVLVAASGCTHVHSTRNAPGNIELERRPESIVSRKAERPQDPGERMIVLSPGVFGGGGVAVDGRGASGAYAVGAEAGVHYGESERSHFEDTFFGSVLHPSSSVGANVGWTMLSQERTGPSVGYMEIQYTRVGYGLAGGWAWDPRARVSGPQATAFYGPFYLRGTHLLDTRTEIEAGIMLKFPVTWVWSRLGHGGSRASRRPSSNSETWPSRPTMT